MIRILLLLAVAALAACDSFDNLKAGMENSQNAASRIEAAVGVMPYVSYNWNNGVTSVTVTFDGEPAQADFSTVMAATREAVSASFEDEPDQIIISVIIQPGADAREPQSKGDVL